jgi:Zn-dependent protease
MLRAWKIGRFFGIDLYLHWTFLLLPLWAVLSHPENGELSTPFLLAVMGAVFGCVVLHEYGHALTARRFGIGTRDITLYPIGGVARLERISEKPWEEFWIAVGGPAVNVVIALILFCIAVPLLVFNPQLLLDTTAGQFLFAVLFLNVFLVLFNMMPAFPMDGGRVFRAVLSMWLGHLQATRIAARVGLVVAVVGGVLLWQLTGNPWVLIVAFFVLFAGQQELRYVEWRHSREFTDAEPLLVHPVHPPYDSMQPVRPHPGIAQAFVPANGLILQPRVSVFIWDNVTGRWIREAGPQPPRFGEN